MNREGDNRAAAGGSVSAVMQAHAEVAGAALDPNPEAKSHSTVPVSVPLLGSAASTALLLAPGSVVKHYVIIRELGQGGMGSVFLARDTRLARLCAIKLLHAYTGAGVGRFLAEARATARCKHENIVMIYEVDEILGHPYMVLEYLEGRTLRAWMAARDRREPVPPQLAVEIMIPVVRALVCAHEMRIVHRDLKPENIFLTDAGPVKVLDFGVAKQIEVDEMAGAIASARAADADDPALTKQGAHIGTLPYMSPEQWLGRDITPQSDIWAAGIILYELVTGSHPLAPATMPRLLEVQDLAAPMPSVVEQRSDLGRLGDVINRCLDKHRGKRIGTARELLAELEPLVSGRTPARRVKRRSRHRIAALAVTGIAVAVGSATLYRGLGPGARARSTGIAITDVALPPSQYPEARAAYDAALHGFRDANWTVAERQLRRAVALDPMLAAAHLRLAILLNYTIGRAPETRQSYALALQWRAALSERDRDILAAFDPLFTREPPELVRFNERLAALAERRDDDAEVLALHAYYGTEGPEVQLRSARRAVEVDPAYADAWQVVGKQAFELGRTDEALGALDACLAASPAAIDCLGERARVHAALGQCAAVDVDLRDAAATDPDGRYWRELWASALLTLGRPVETVVEVLTRKWAGQPESRRELVELHDRARLALLRGRFEEARAAAAALQARTQQPDADQHARYAMLLIDLAIEAGRLGEAADVAEAYLQRRDAWVTAGNLVDDMAMVIVLRDAGRLSQADFDARRAAWLARHRGVTGSVRNAIWLTAWVRSANTPEAATAALATAPSSDLRVLAHSLADQAAMGALLLRAGRAGEAVRFLERAAHGCDGFLAPIAHVRAAAQLGRALEATGDRRGACAAYQLVLDRWATASSITAREAELRAAALSCAAAANVKAG